MSRKDPFPIDRVGIEPALEAFDAELRGPLGALKDRSYRLEGRAEDAIESAARNLLAKAVRALQQDDEPRACRLVERAFALPRMEGQVDEPSLMEAHMLLYLELVQQARASAEGDERWLDRVEALLEELPEPANSEVRRALDGVLEADATPSEARRIRRLVKPGSSDDPVLGELADRRERVAGTLGMLRALINLRERTD